MKDWMLFIWYFIFLFNNYENSLNYKCSNDTTIKQIEKGLISDTSFSFKKYSDFLTKISDTSKFLVLPINEFRNVSNSNKIVIGLRHDIDVDINKAIQMAEIENQHKIRSSYFVLHTADYYLKDPSNKSIHDTQIIQYLQKLQNQFNHEIGIHNDLVTLQIVYNFNSKLYLKEELKWLRSKGIRIYGTVAHGSNYCNVYRYLNFYFFKECEEPFVPNFENNLKVKVGKDSVNIMKSYFKEFDLDYEAYFVDHNIYFSDVGKEWSTDNLNLNKLQVGGKYIILIHPDLWHGDDMADIEHFQVNGQIKANINYLDTTVNVFMPESFLEKPLKVNISVSKGSQLFNNNLDISNMNTIIITDLSKTIEYLIISKSMSQKKNWKVNFVCVGRSSTESHFDLKIYPNPATDKINIVINKGIITSPIEIYNSQGKKVYSFEPYHYIEEEINVSSWAKGIYIIRFTSMKKEYSYKFVHL